MKIIAAYLLTVLGGNTNPNENDIERVLHSVGISTPRESVGLLLDQVHGKDVDQVISSGLFKLNIAPKVEVQPIAPAPMITLPVERAISPDPIEGVEEPIFSIFD